MPWHAYVGKHQGFIGNIFDMLRVFKAAMVMSFCEIELERKEYGIRNGLSQDTIDLKPLLNATTTHLKCDVV